ncbi:MAG: Asp-tRNA(Asn)/Glu-tRNA(Gln) amidotransferase subunit GatA [Acidobacteria bacterium]|nr:Asp-tRNA(Asn)/Glu-tRNA(Gln) amidotransferase subunit GatA [Acidobacteriota bacterium]
MIAPTARAAAAAVASGDVSAEELARAALARIEARADINAVVHVDPPRSLARARSIDARRARGEPVGPLAGVPLAVKDNICTRGLPATCASRILGDYVPPYDATAVARLLAAGAVVVGKTNCDEFGMGSSNENSCFGPARHPLDPARVTGGSSGGSAAAVADRQALAALGSDTGGSVRQPAAFCGVVGLKPTYGRVSRWGLIAFGSSLDQVGPLAADVTDAALLLGVIAGPDGRDATCVPEDVPDYLARLDDGGAGLRVGVLREFAEHEALAADVREAVRRAAERLAARGAATGEAALPLARHGIPIYYIVATAEASSNLARYDGVRYGRRADEAADIGAMYAATRGQGFGDEVKRRIVLGTYALSAGYHDRYYARAQRARALLRRQLDALFETFDVLLCPTTPTAAFRIGEKADDPLAMYLGDIFTVVASLGGHPAISVPFGRTAEGLPLGVQLIGPRFGEQRLLRAARCLE